MPGICAFLPRQLKLFLSPCVRICIVFSVLVDSLKLIDFMKGSHACADANLNDQHKQPPPESSINDENSDDALDAALELMLV